MPIKILAIDDSKTMRLAIKITFAAEDAQVVAVSKGSEAIPRAKQHGADIILIDHTLAAGEPSGLQVVQELKANPATAKIPVILLIPARGGTSEADALAAGADAAVGKPFDTQELIDRVNAVLSGQKGKPAAAAAATAKPPVAATTPAKPPVAATAKPPVAATTPAKPPVAATAKPPTATPAATPAAKPPGTTPAATAPAAKPTPAAATAAKPTPAAAATAAKPTPAAATPAAAAKPTPAAATAAKPATTPAAVPGVRPAATTAAAQPVTVGKQPAPGGPIPIARPIPFTSASSPTAGMLERLKAASGGAAAGLDPGAVRALLQLSQEVVEQVVWEVVPDLAEQLIKERMQQSSPR